MIAADDLFTDLFQDHCIQCHDTDNAEADVDVSQLTHEKLQHDVTLVGRLIDVLRFEEMPPPDESMLSPQQRSEVIIALKDVRNAALADRHVGRRTPIRRMNRFQYNNAVIDLFDLNCIVFTLPERMMREHRSYFKPGSGQMADVVHVGSRPLGKSQMIEPRLAGVAAFPQDLRAEHGYDNQADHLSLSPLLMESFLKLGQSVTQSPDFNPRHVGIWKSFFALPKRRGEGDDETPALQIEAQIDVAKRRLRPFLTRAFRRPVDEHTLTRYTEFVGRQIRAGGTFTESMLSAAAATLASPRFLYLYDQPDDDLVGAPLDGFELASRLSFFLWGSIPDESLMQLAQNGQLLQSDTLADQVDRMLRDRKVKRFCDSFPAQWLQLDRIISSVPDRETYPDFYFSKYRDSMHMMLEPLLLFETVLVEDRPITEFIDSEFTYRSTLLDDAYGELSQMTQRPKGNSAVTVLPFYRVAVRDRRAGGVITNAAVMTMTSGPLRTQPITRGAWIASVIFNQPPDPPPADVPPLDEKPPEQERDLTLRERLSLHRQRSDCRGCHEQIDPLGFALENYDPIGKWREHYGNGRQVDVGGQLWGRHAFDDVVAFKDAILSEKIRFTQALAGHLLSFALARRLDVADQLAIESIASKTSADHDRMKSLIKYVVLSDPFSRN
ncbi:MAG: DUF1592 domain-containing protein [Planctomycetota bacterium]